MNTKIQVTLKFKIERARPVHKLLSATVGKCKANVLINILLELQRNSMIYNYSLKIIAIF